MLATNLVHYIFIYLLINQLVVRKTLLYISFLFFITGCAPKLPLKSSYLQSNSRLGFILVTTIQSNGTASSGGLGLVGALVSSALKPKTKYDEALAAIEPELDPYDNMKQLFTKTFSSKGKTIVFIEDTLNPDELKDFEIPPLPPRTTETKRFFKKDLRFLKDKYDIDEVLVVTVNYGIYCKYSYGIETARYGVTYISPELVNLMDNSLLYRDATSARVHIKGKWKTPPKYENLKTGISASINQATQLQKDKYANLQ